MKHKTNKLWSILLAIVMMVGLLPATAMAEDAEEKVAINEENFPDPVFRDFVQYNYGDDEGNASLSDLQDVTDINCASQYIISEGGTKTYIKSLEGIEYFTSLESLNCTGNKLVWLDMSQNTALTTLSCSSNKLLSLDISSNKALTELFCSDNGLEILNVSNNTALKKLNCSGNDLKGLDVSNNIALTELSCGSNTLEELDVSSNKALTELFCSDNGLEILNVSNNTALKKLNCSGNDLKGLDVSNNIALTELSCGSNTLAELDVSKNTKLTTLSCDSNPLQELDVSQNTALVNLSCKNNQLKKLKLGNNNNLMMIECKGNQLAELDVRRVPKIRDAVINNISKFESITYLSEKGMLNVDSTVNVIYVLSGGSGGGGGGGASAYAVEVAKVENGSVTASPTSAKAGDKVTLTPKPAEGYETDKITVTDKNGKEVAVTKNSDGTYSFTMPSSKVSVKPAFKKATDTAPEEETSLFVVSINSMKYQLNGNTMTMDSAPFIDGNNRTMLPVRVIANALGITNDNIKWDSATKTAYFTRADGKIVSCTVNSNVIQIGDEKVTIDTVPVIRNDRIYLPMRALFNAFDVPDENILWDAAARTVTVTKKD